MATPSQIRIKQWQVESLGVYQTLMETLGSLREETCQELQSERPTLLLLILQNPKGSTISCLNIPGESILVSLDLYCGLGKANRI
jgi:hypothetical protein